MDGIMNGLLVMAVLLGLCGLFWAGSVIDQAVQKWRGVAVGINGRRPDGPLAYIIIGIVMVAGGVWHAASGSPPPEDSIAAIRR